MQKYDLSDCSIVIPISIDFSERLEHVHFLSEYFKRNFVHHQLIIVEQGSEPKIHLSSEAGIQMHFLEGESGSFSVSQSSNFGASLVKTPFFCRCDADALIHPKAIFDAFELLKQQPQISFIFPFNGITFDVSGSLRKHILESLEVRDLPFFTKGELKNAKLPHLRLHNPNTKGLIHHFRTDLFKQFGGYNEDFIGWGYEDDEIVNRFQVLGHPKVYLENYNAFHFIHPRKTVDPKQVFQNYCRMTVLKHSSPEELWNDIRRWSRFFS